MLRTATVLMMVFPTIAAATPSTTRCLDAGEQGSKVQLQSDGGAPGRATLCWADGCLAYAPNAAPIAVPSKPMPRFVPEAEVRDDHGHLAVCSTGRCDSLGPKLTAAIEAARKDNEGCGKCDPPPGPLSLEATRDRAVVVLTNSRLGPPAWNVADDKPIVFAAERKLAHARSAGVSVAGNDLVLGWFVCPGRSTDMSCTVDEIIKTTLADAKGRDLGGTYEGFETIDKVSGERYVTTGGDAGAIQLIDHGRVVSRLAFPWKYPFYQQFAQIDDEHVALVWGRADTYHLALISVGKKALTSVELARFPVCGS